MESRERGIPLDIMSGAQIPAYLRLFAGSGDVGRALEAHYQDDPAAGAPVEIRGRFDSAAKERVGRIFEGMNFDREFPKLWRRAGGAITSLAQTFFGPDASYFDLVNRVSSPPIEPHDVAKLLLRSDATSRVAHQARLMTMATGAIAYHDQMTQNPILRQAFERLDGTFDQTQCTGQYAEQGHAHLVSLHDPLTLKTISTVFDGSLTYDDRYSVRSQRLPIRHLKDGNVPFFTNFHLKPDSSSFGKALEKSLKDGLQVVHPAERVNDTHGLLFVPMHAEQYDLLKHQVIKHAMTTFPLYKLEEDNSPSRGLSGERIVFDRVNLIPDSSKPNAYIELMFQRPYEYTDSIYYVGKNGEGCAHSLYQIQRGMREIRRSDGTNTSLVDFMFPENVYGVNPRKVAQAQINRTVARLRAGH